MFVIKTERYVFVPALIKIHLSIMKDIFDAIMNDLVYRGKCLVVILRTIVTRKLFHVIVNDFYYLRRNFCLI